MRTRQTLRAALALCLSCAGGLLPLRRGHGVRSEGRARRRVTAVDDLAVSAFLEEPLRTRSGESDSAARTSGLQASGSDSLAFFAPDQSKPRPADYDDYDDLLPPPMPEPVREGELGEGRYGDAGGGRTEGFYAALQEAPDRLRASDLNEVLLPDHLERLRFTNFPLQAYGALFKWDTLIDDVLYAYRRPWQVVAEAHDLRMPDDEEVLRAVGMRPERAIQQTFLWSNDWGRTQQLAFEHYEAKADLMRAHEFSPADGVLSWLEVLNEYQVPCCLCAGTSLDQAAVEQVLDKAGLKEYFDSAVTAEDGCETAEQSYLVGSIKLRRPPARCVVFEDDPRGVAAAHEATAKAVAILGRHYGSDLRHADMRVSGFDELSLMSLRELFKDQAPV